MMGAATRLVLGGALCAALALVVWLDGRKDEGVAVVAVAPVCDQASYRDRVRCGRGVSDERMVRERTLTVLPSEIDERTLPADFHEAHRMVAHAVAERAAGRTTRVRVTLKAERKRAARKAAKPRRKVVTLPDRCNRYRHLLGRGLTWDEVDFLENTCMRTGVALDPMFTLEGHW